jgi:hypothetical protein
LPYRRAFARPSMTSGRAKACFVWGTWLLAVGAALRLAHHGRRFPFADDWVLLPVLTRDRPPTLDWLWAPHNEHRIAVPKVIYLLLYNSSMGYDFRSGIYFNVCLLGGAAAVLLLAARQVRGQTTYSDAFFPLALLHWGVGALWWSFSVPFVTSTVLSILLLALIVQSDSHITMRNIIAVGLSLVVLPLCGANGLVLVPCLAAWLAYRGIHQRELRTPHSTAITAVAAGLAAASLLLCILYFVRYERPPSMYASTGLAPAVRTATTFFASGVASPLSSWLDGRPSWRLAMSILLTATAALVVSKTLRAPRNLPRAVGLLLFLGAIVALGLALGVGRGARAWDTLDSHYGTLAIPILCWVYFAWEVYGSRATSQLVQMSLLALMCGVFALNLPSGLDHYPHLDRAAAVVEEDVRAGLSPCDLARRHLRLFWWQDTAEGREIVSGGLRMLHRARAQPFDRLRDDAGDPACPRPGG